MNSFFYVCHVSLLLLRLLEIIRVEHRITQTILHSTLYVLWEVSKNRRSTATCRAVDVSYCSLEQIKTLNIHEAAIDSYATYNFVLVLDVTMASAFVVFLTVKWCCAQMRKSHFFAIFSVILDYLQIISQKFRHKMKRNRKFHTKIC